MKAVVKPRIKLDDRPKIEEMIPLSTPLVVFCDPASACNFACTFCPTGHQELIADRFNGIMKLDLFKKIVDDLAEFDKPIKVLRLYKDGEPLLNKRLPDMVSYAKKSGHVEIVDTTTNGSLIDPERIGPVIEAGIDRINISVDGMDEESYKNITKAKFDFPRFVRNVEWLYKNKGNCTIHIKTIREVLNKDQEKEFIDTFGNYCDEIFVENFSPCWPDFDSETKTGWTYKTGLYGQEINKEALVCPYIFYGYSVNADGLVSACFIDWGRKLIIGDTRKQSMVEIWNSQAMNDLRLLHLRGERKCHGVCGKCGQLTNCLPDNIDDQREELLERMNEHLCS